MERPKNIKRILVTGVSGQLGCSIQDIASKYPNLDFIFTDSQDLDITDSQMANKFFENYNFDYCINCAAYTDVEQVERLPKMAFDINAEG